VKIQYSNVSDDWPVAWIVLAHNSITVECAKFLFDVLWNPTDLFIIHLDTKAQTLLPRLKELLLPYPGTRFYSQFNSEYASWDLIRMELEMMQIAMGLQDVHPWNQLQILSGDTYVTKPLLEIKKRMKNGKPFRLSEPNPLPFLNTIKTSWRADMKTAQQLARLVRHKMLFWWGTQWVMLSRQAVEYVLTDGAAIELRKVFFHTYCSDESYFQTVLMEAKTSPFTYNGSFKEYYNAATIPDWHMHTAWENFNKEWGVNDTYKIIKRGAWFVRKVWKPEVRAVIDKLRNSDTPPHKIEQGPITGWVWPQNYKFP
jgi:hypothetical protein